MVLGIGSHCFLQPPIVSSPSQSVLLCVRNGDARRGRISRAPTASLRQEDAATASGKRRAVLLLGISVLPFLQLRAIALQNPASKASELRRSEVFQKAELPQAGPSGNPLVSLLNGLGIFGSAVLGALYALVQNEKRATDTTLESLKIKLEEKEAALVSMEKDFESKLLNEREEQSKQLKKAKEELLSLLDQLNLANNMIADLGQELKQEKKFIAELKDQIDRLQSDLLKAGEDQKALEEKLKEKHDTVEVLQERINILSLEIKEKENYTQKLSSSVDEKESELKNLNAAYKKTQDELGKALTDSEGLKSQLLKNQVELQLKNSVIVELEAKLNSLATEKDTLKGEYDALQEGYNDMKLASQKRAAVDANILEERKNEIHQLKVKLDHAVSEVSKSQAHVADLTEEREHFKGLLNTELWNVKSLKDELEQTQEVCGKYEAEVSDLMKQLNQSRNLCAKLESEVSKVQAAFDETRERSQRTLDETKQSAELLAGELNTAKELLKKTGEELQMVTHELSSEAEKRESLQKELMDVYKKAESTANDLKEEKKIVSSLSKELEAFEKQILKDKEVRKSLETDLEEATKSLDEMNRNALELSKELEKTNAQISNLEDEKLVLYRSLTEEKNASREAQENMEDAHNLVMRLGRERETLEKRAKKLEDELAAAKGEILRLRSQINSPKAVVDQQLPQKEKDETKVTVNAKRNGRRRKAGSQ